jgi:hypothetical protein
VIGARRLPPDRLTSLSKRFVAGLVLALVALTALHAVVAAPADAADGEQAPHVIVRPEEGEIWRLYRAVLGRHPDQNGFAYWVARRVEGVPLSVVADSFLASREFEARFGTTSDDTFLDLVYRNVLGRLGDAEGVAYWRGVLAAGYPRRNVVLLFAESAEHRAVTGTELRELPAFAPVVRSVGAAELGASWRPDCPIGPEKLRAVDLDHVGPTGAHRRGTLIVRDDAADDVIAVFRALYAARFPISAMRPVSEFDGDDDASMAAGNTSAFNCRVVTGGTGWSRHAFGTAIDLNPVENPYVAGAVVLPPAGVDYVDRDGYHPAMIRPGDIVTRSFDEVGWRWGGDYVSLADYQHFER